MVSRLILQIDFIFSFSNGFFPSTIVTVVLSVRVVAAVFQNTKAFNADVSKWNTGKVTTMRFSTSTSVLHLFQDGISRLFFDDFFFNVFFISIVLSPFLVVVFSRAEAFNADISKWDTGNVTGITGMGDGMGNSTSISVPHLFMNGVSIDIGN